MKDKISLFLSFFKIGIFTFGGGYAMISLMQKEVVEDKKWITSEDMSDMITISESTPGPISVNVATFVGYKVAGVFGALFATLAEYSKTHGSEFMTFFTGRKNFARYIYLSLGFKIIRSFAIMEKEI